MLDKLFGSRTRVKLLQLFLTHTEEEYFVRELSRTIQEQINSVRRELKNLETIGLLKSENRDKKKYYTVSKKFELFEELRALIVKSRLTLEKEFIDSIRSLGSISYLSLTGYFVDDSTAKVDLLIVGTVARKKLDTFLITFQKHFGRQLRFTILEKEEFIYRRDVADKFLHDILQSKKIILIDKFSKD